MDEYYCPNCQAILNDQYGFFPEDSNWSCTECGQELYGDNVYEGVAYPGVMWHCDQCNSLLNKQVGFNDFCGSWTCTVCMHTNSISFEDTTISDDNSDGLAESLGTLGTALLVSLGTTIMGAYQEKRQQEKRLEEERQQKEEKIRLEKQKKRIAKRKKYIKKIKNLLFGKKKIMIGVEATELIGNDVSVVVFYLQNLGFTEIQIIPKANVYGEVEKIYIDGDSGFQKDSMIASNAKIVITHCENPSTTKTTH